MGLPCGGSRNELIFNGNRWHKTKIERVVWESLLDYGRLSGSGLCLLIKKHLDDEGRI